MSAPGAGILLALSGDDADILRALSRAGSGLCVVRRCADLPELLSAGMAGLASFALLDTGFDEIDRTVLDRLGRAGLRGLLLVEAHEEERWRSAGWPVLRRDAAPDSIRSVLQELVRSSAVDPSTASPDSLTASWPAPETVNGSVSESAAGVGSASDDWLSAATPASSAERGAAQETAWLEELWRQSPDPEGTGASPARTGPGPVAVGPDVFADISPGQEWAPVAGEAAQESSAVPPSVAPDRPRVTGGPRSGPHVPARDGGNGRIVLVWGPHGAPGRSTVAASLAHGLAGPEGAILVDADVEAPSLVQLLGMPEDSSALAGAARLATHGRLDAESFQRLLAPVGGGLSLLGGLGRAGRWRELPPASMTEVWLQCRRSAAWTVVDVAGGVVDDDVDDFTLEPGRGAVTADLVTRADVVVVVGGADPIGVRRLLQLLDEVGSSVMPAGRVEVVLNRVRATAAGPSPQQALREALARFGGVEDIVLLPDDGATADACLLQGCSVLEGASGSSLGKALTALVDRIDPQAGAGRRGSSSRRPLLWRRRRRDRTEGSAGRTKASGRKRRFAARSRDGRSLRGGAPAAEARAPAPGTPRGVARAPQQPQQARPPSTLSSPRPLSVSRGPAGRPGAAPWQGVDTDSVPDPGAGHGPAPVSDTGHGAAEGDGQGGGQRNNHGHGDPPPGPPGPGRHRY